MGKRRLSFQIHLLRRTASITESECACGTICEIHQRILLGPLDTFWRALLAPSDSRIRNALSPREKSSGSTTTDRTRLSLGDIRHHSPPRTARWNLRRLSKTCSLYTLGRDRYLCR